MAVDTETARSESVDTDTECSGFVEIEMLVTCHMFRALFLFVLLAFRKTFGVSCVVVFCFGMSSNNSHKT